MMRKYNQNSGFGPLFSTVTAMVSPAHQVITQRPLYEQVAPLQIRPGVGSFVRRTVGWLQQWRRRAGERQALMRLDERLLQDIGIERVQARAEWEKPFWRN